MVFFTQVQFFPNYTPSKNRKNQKAPQSPLQYFHKTNIKQMYPAEFTVYFKQNDPNVVLDLTNADIYEYEYLSMGKHSPEYPMGQSFPV